MKRFTKEYHDNKVKRILDGGLVRNPAFRRENGGFITENPTFNYKFQKLILKGMRVNNNDVREALKELQADFQQSCMYRQEILTYGRSGIFMHYLTGLPTVITLPFFYGDIASYLVELTGEEKIREMDPEEVDFFYWAHVEYAIHTLLREHCLPPMDSLDILN